MSAENANMKGNYYLTYWGEVKNDNWIERELGIKETDFWFDTHEERDDFEKKLRVVAEAHGCIIAIDKIDGAHTHKRTVAKMIMVMTGIGRYYFEYDFGYGYDAEAARYMFEYGSLSCDCNKSRMLRRQYPNVPKLDCGDTIEIEDFMVKLV